MTNYDQTIQDVVGNGYKNELRNTPGYTNYVVGVNKNLSGAITSAQLKRYYSAIDAELYFNGEWIEDISNISWNITQKTIPLFGYNSYIWDDVAQGTRIISGEFTIAFTDPMLVDDAISSETVEGMTIASYEEVQKSLLEKDVKTSSNGGNIFENPKHYHIWEASGGRTVGTGLKIYKGFDIDIVCGEKEQRGGFPVHIILKNCVIQAMGTMRTASGGASAIEQYTFMAQDFIRIK